MFLRQKSILLHRTRNPERLVKFTYSQRLNTQLVLDDFLLKKKKGPSWSRGMRKITWRWKVWSNSFSDGVITAQVRGARLLVLPGDQRGGNPPRRKTWPPLKVVRTGWQFMISISLQARQIRKSPCKISDQARSELTYRHNKYGNFYSPNRKLFFGEFPPLLDWGHPCFDTDKFNVFRLFLK